MGLVVDEDSVEDMLFDLNRDNTNKSIYAKQFGMNSLNQQIAQSSIDEAYSEQLMTSYQTFLQQQNQANSLGLIDGLKDEVNEYNYDALSKAYKTSMNERLNNTYNVYSNYLEAQGKIGTELTSLAEAYGKRADSYLDYMKQANLQENILDYLKSTGIITDVGVDGSPHTFADDSVIRNKMFATETTYDEQGNVLVNKGDLTDEGRAILNMLQSNHTNGDADEQSELSYDAWIENQEKYKDDRVDKAVMRDMLGIEGEYGRTYDKRDMMGLSADYRASVAAAESAKLDKVKLENNTTYQAIISGNDVRVSSEDITKLDKDFTATIDSIRSSLSEYGFSEEEFNEFLKAEGCDFTLDTIGKSSLEEMKKYVVTENELGIEDGIKIQIGIHRTAAALLAAEAAVCFSVAAGCTALAFLTFGAAAAGTAALIAQGSVSLGLAAVETAAASLLQSSLNDYSKSLDQKVSGMRDPAKTLGVHYTTIKEKFEKFMKESK